MDADGNGHCRHQVIDLRELCIAGLIDELEFVEYFDRVLHLGLGCSRLAHRLKVGCSSEYSVSDNNGQNNEQNNG